MTHLAFQRPDRTRLWRRLTLGGLFASLLVNAFLGAIIARQVLGGPSDREQLSRLPGEDRALVREAVQQARPGLRQAGRSLRAAEDAVRAALRAEPFDPVALEAALAQMRVANAAMHQQVHAIITDVAPGLGQEGRRALSQLNALRARPLAGGPGPNQGGTEP